MIFGWFDAREATDAGTALAEFLAERLPVDSAGGKHKQSEKKQKELFPKLFAQADRSKSEHRLNVFKKAKLGNAFKWKLLDLGYDPDFVDEATKEVLARL